MSQRELVKSVFDKLDRLHIPGMLTGSHASGVYGSIRSTHDIDIVVDLRPANVAGLMAEFPPADFYLSQQAVEQAIRELGEFNAIEQESGVKVDFWILKRDAFSRSAFSRRRIEEVWGRQIPVCSPEDLILQKLHWAKRCGGSEKQMYDCRTVLELQHKSIDFDYISGWIDTLAIGDYWRELQGQVQIENN